MNSETFTAFRLAQQRASELERETERRRRLAERGEPMTERAPGHRRRGLHLTWSRSARLGAATRSATASGMLTLMLLAAVAAPASAAEPLPAVTAASHCLSTNTAPALRPPMAPVCY